MRQLIQNLMKNELFTQNQNQIYRNDQIHNDAKI